MYVVIENTPGYLPDADELVEFDTLRDARAYARGQVEELREFAAQVDETVRVRTDSRTAPRYWRVESVQREHDLGRVIEILDKDLARWRTW